MSLSPLKPSNSQPLPPGKGDRNRRSQALLVTAGLAGVVGLCSGVIIRFSLSNSPTTRFLSPLQTFPDLADWAPQLPQGTADSHYLPGGSAASDESTDAATYGEEGGRDREASSENRENRALDADAAQPAEPIPSDTGVSSEAPSSSDYSQDTYVEEPYVEEPYPEESYPEETYAEPYPEETYAEPYPEESYGSEGGGEGYYSEDYPATEVPVGEESADYGSEPY
jgi:hypothetical protein